jgi:hypothetical protein
MYAPYIKQYEPLRMECQEFLDSIKARSRPESSGTEGLLVVQILEAASKSLKNNGAMVKIEPVDQLDFFVKKELQIAAANT